MHVDFINSPQGCCRKIAAMPTFKFSEFRIYLSLMEILFVVFLENCAEILAGLDCMDAKEETEGK